jgi:ABC-type multidrug transport system fused ATPase/permease subunit
LNVLKRLVVALRPYWPTLVLIAVVLLAQAGVELLPPLFQQRIVDGVIGKQNLGQFGFSFGTMMSAYGDILSAQAGSRVIPLLFPSPAAGQAGGGLDFGYLGLLLAGMVGVYAVLRAINVADQYLRHTLGEKFIYDLRVKLYAYLQRLSLSFFERTSTGELMSRLTNDVNSLEDFVTHGSSLTLVDMVRLLSTAAVLLVLDWRLALAVLIPLPILAGSLRWFNHKVRPMYRQVRARLGDINAQLQDSLAGMRVIQAFGQENAQLGRFSAESEAYYHARVRAIRTWATFFPAFRFVASIGPILVLGVAAWLIVGGESSLGTLVAFLSYTTSFYEPLHRLTEVDNMIQQALAAGERIFELLDNEPEVQDAPDAIDLPEVRGQVCFEDVHFRYGEGDEVLHDVDFTIAPGEVVALVGPSGAGKTSIANLVSRFYDPIHGRVTLDGHDLRGVKLACLRQHVAVVLQDTFLFNTSVRENIAYGKPDATDEEIVAAARAANTDEFIAQLPDGYYTEIGERGVRLSGGQKQRLALARAILANPRVLILDEATSSVDAEAEFLIQQALQEVLRGRTALIIAHRLSTIRNADKIVALEGGRIREIGDHHELLRQGGLYSQLYRRQVEMAVAGEDAGLVEVWTEDMDSESVKAEG